MYGPQGAAEVYGRQKGADDRQIELLDAGMKNVAELIKAYNGKVIANLSGAGAAGGIAAGLYGLLDQVVIENGFDYLSSVLELSKYIEASDLVISGEGGLDRQSLQGKVVGKVATLSQQAKVPLAVIVGQYTLEKAELAAAGIIDCVTVRSLAESDKDAMNRAEHYIIELGKIVGEDISAR